MKLLAPFLGPIRRGTRWASRHFWTLLASSMFLMLVLMAAARLMLPSLDTYREDIEGWLSTTVGVPVEIGSIGAEWNRWVPELRIEDVRLLNSKNETVLDFEALLIRINPMASVLDWTLNPSRVTVRGAALTIVRQPDGTIRVCCLDQTREPEKEALAKWLFSNRHLTLTSSTITWHDRKRGLAPMVLHDTSVRLRNYDSRHQLDARFTLPEKLGESLTLAMDVFGDPSSSGWSGELYLEGNGLRLDSRLARDLYPREFALADGTGNLKLWGSLHNGRLEKLLGEVGIADLDLSFKEGRLPLTATAGTFRYHQDDGRDWKLELAANHFQEGDTALEGQELQLMLTGESDRVTWVEGSLNHLTVPQALTYLRPLSPEAAIEPWLQEADPTGELHNLSFAHIPGDTTAAGLNLKVDAEDLNINATGDYPGITGLAGQLRLRGTQGIMEFHDRTVEVDLPTLFVNTLRTDTLKGAITWQREKEGWNIATDLLTLANPDIRLQLSGEMHLPDSGDSPSIFLVGSYHDGNGEALATYLPQHIMTKDVVDWLKISIINGRVDSGGLLVHGALADFPFDHGTGRFEIRSNLSNVILDFAPGWPRIEEIEAELLFHGRSLAIHATEGKILGSNIRQTHASIADLEADETLLRIQGTAHGPGGDGIRILTETPLKENFRHYLPQTSINGEIQVAMNIDIPFYDAPSRTKGSITFDRNHILSSSLNLDLEKVTGLLNFTDESMTATGLSGELQKMPVSLAVETTTQAEEPLTRVQVSGQITPEYLIQRLFHSSGSTSKKKVPEFFSRFQGEATWRATLDLPDSATAEVSPPSLAVESELKGLSLDLPEPFGKSAAETGFLRIATTLTTDRQQVIEIEYGANFRGILSLLARKGGFHFDRGAIYLGSASGALPDEQGLQVFGELSEFSTTAWLDLLYQPSNPDKTIPPPPPASPAKSKGHLKRITIKAKQFEVMGQWTADMELQAAAQDSGEWKAVLDAPNLSGTLVIPAKGTGAPLILKFDRLALKVSDREVEERPQDPRQLPPVEFTCGSFSVNDIPLGKVILVTHPQPRGTHIDKLEIQSKDSIVTATGNWITRNDKQISRFRIAMSSPDLGALLDNLGYDRAALEGGDTRIEIDAAWNGAPTQFALDRLNGILSLDVTKGRLLDVNPGASGRIFGLLSLQALPRRLKLDFSDLFNKGFAYDQVKGDFTIDSGDAYTNNLYMLAPAARIDIAGRVGLASRDYDQIMTISPEVSTTMPLAGALAGGPVGAAVGAVAAFVAEKLFKTELNQVVNTQYLITGGWSDPTIERIHEEVPK